MQTGRIVYIDWLKAFTIFLVLLGHSAQKFSVSGVLTPIFYVGAFHMPLFMMLSGFFLGKSLDRGLKFILFTRSRQLLLPVLSFSVMVFAVAKFIPILDVTEGLDFFAYITGGDMWFLKYLYAGTLLAYVSDRIFRIRILAAVLPASLLISLSRVGIFVYYPYLWLGYYVHKYEHIITRHLRWLLPVSFIIFAILLLLWNFDYEYPYYRILTIKNGVYFSSYDCLIVIFRFAIGAIGSLAFVCMFKKIRWDNIEMRFPAFSKFCLNAGKRTLGIYCLQIYLLEDVGRCVTLPEHSALADVAIVFGVAVAEFMVCNILVGLMEKCKHIRLLFLGQR